MLETEMPTKTYKGTWSEVLAHREEIALTSEVEVRVFEPKRDAPDAENQALINLLRSWRQEDVTDNAQELERRDAATQELMTNLQANRLTLPVPEV